MWQTFFPWCFNCRSRLTSNSVVTHSLFLTKSKNCVQPHSFLFINSVLLQVIPDIYVKEKKKIPVLNPPFVVDRVYSGGDGHSDAFGGSRHLTGNVQNLHHGWGIAAALPFVWCFLLTGDALTATQTLTVFLIPCCTVYLMLVLQVYSIRTRARAVEIFTTCANLICAIEELEKVK